MISLVYIFIINAFFSLPFSMATLILNVKDILNKHISLKILQINKVDMISNIVSK